MTGFSLVRSIGWSAGLLFVTILCTPVCPAQAKSGAAAELAALLQKHDEALNQHDLDALMKLYSPSPKTVIMGTGPDERFQGADQIKAAYTEIFKDFDKGTMTHNCYWKDGAVVGTLAWLAAECKLSDSKGDKKREFELNISVVAEKTGGTWRFVMLHYSNVVGGGSQ